MLALNVTLNFPIGHDKIVLIKQISEIWKCSNIAKKEILKEEERQTDYQPNSFLEEKATGNYSNCLL